jgi:hypothetical protein
MSQFHVANVRRAALLVLLLVGSCHTPYLLGDQSTANCHGRLIAAYTSGSLPDNLRQLCDTDHHPTRAWLANIELGADLDIVRYWDLQQLAADIDHTVPTATLSDPLLASVLAETTKQLARSPSWLERLRTWLDERLRARGDADLAWLENWLEKLARHQGLLELVLRVTVVLVLVFALYVVLREIEIGGGWRWPWVRTDRKTPITKLDTPTAVVPLLWSDVLAMPASVRPAALLRWLLLEFGARQLLPGDASLTNRELLARLQIARPALCSPFAALLDELEPCIYGQQQLPHIDALTQRVADLHCALEHL